ncbi:bifunctional 4-hydroxy-2-oxoglutarate aldolase/2-dehydro-3-deoxy-phosphogluconate aldolase [Alkalihalobacillus sp. CinArs1]|uniref:bifunctional 4-hydroxy-2-oxoglutarate aldolase/2-dehydro-3-deoxy-phosphogluconate aldolase n=1 Tax=Alkalihalobacillus sp. CinArs1 TaxID=2995314 RepID=UPI0022DE7950|nr:bifunctional 4-hydroxy-2-oxoglutarate aldolase/2-dehydro-3-deoxy-phosphogluconate aldolase [Alkalihalobacillus sp. CinArs1]
MKQENLTKMMDGGIVAVVRKIDRNKVIKVIECLIDGGITAVEVTLDSEDALGVLKEASQTFRGRAVIGAGTVLDEQSANIAIHAGADFIFAPTIDEGTIKLANRYGKIVIPGVFTPTEILNAQECGADLVKVFPASVLGPKFIKDVKGPLNHVNMMPTGGVNLHNTAEYIRAGAVAVGVGGSLLQKELIDQERWGDLETLARDYTEEVQKGRAALVSSN